MMGRTMRVTFDEVKLSTVRSGRCARCGKRTRRTIRVFQTINPFNKNKKTGLPKSREEILVELRQQIADEKAKPLNCTGCE